MQKLQENVEHVNILWQKDNVRVIHVLMKMPGPISNRQVVAVNTVKVEGDKAIIGNRSCDYPAKLDKDA